MGVIKGDGAHPHTVAAWLAQADTHLPDWAKNYSINSEKAARIYRYLADNKVLLRTLSTVEDSFRLPLVKKLCEEYRPFLESHELGQRLSKEIEEIARAFQKHSLDLFFIKSSKTFPLDSDNFDIMVREEEEVKVWKLLESMGFVHITWVEEPYKHLFRRVKDGDTSLAFHLHKRLSWEGVEFVDCSELWARRRQVKVGDIPVFMPSKEHHILITLAHAFFENHCFKLSDLTYLLDSTTHNSWKTALEWAISNGWEKPFSAMMLLADHISKSLFTESLLLGGTDFGSHEVRKSSLGDELIRKYRVEKSLPLKISIVTVAKEFAKKIFADSHTRLSKKIEITTSLFWRGILKRTRLERRRPRLLVCFSGVDASGKTTHALELFTRLKKKGFDVRYVWSRGFGLSFEPLLSVVRRLFGLRHKSMSRETYANRREFLLRDKGSRKLWSFLVLTDHLLQVAFQVTSQLMLCDLVICDRYVHDTLIDVRCELGTRVSNPLMKLIGNLAPKPDIVFFLDASPEEIERRKEGAKDMSTECKISAYNCLSREQKNVFTINTDAPLEQNRNRVVDFVLKKFYSSV